MTEGKGERFKEFGREIQTLGTLRGFKHFEAYLRGKEELLITVKTNEGQVANVKRLLLTMRHEGQPQPTQTRRGKRSQQQQPQALIPASPCSRESDRIKNSADAIFLLSCYATYSRPLVWLRSTTSSAEGVVTQDINDKPLLLDSTDCWNSGDDVCAWEVIEELVKETLGGKELNPFEIDFDYLESMSNEEKCIASGALVNFLWEIYSGAIGNSVAVPFSHFLFQDLQKVTTIHFSSVSSLITSSSLK